MVCISPARLQNATSYKNAFSPHGEQNRTKIIMYVGKVVIIVFVEILSTRIEITVDDPHPIHRFLMRWSRQIENHLPTSRTRQSLCLTSVKVHTHPIIYQTDPGRIHQTGWLPFGLHLHDHLEIQRAI